MNTLVQPPPEETMSLADLFAVDPRSTREERGLLLFHQGELPPDEPRPQGNREPDSERSTSR